MRLTLFILLATCLVLTGCQTTGRETLTQHSTIDALLIGMYDGDLEIGDLRRAGNFGIGTFDGLDGEMIVLDGAVYKARSDGRIVRMGDRETTPFASVSYFHPDIHTDIPPGIDYPALEALLTGKLASPNLFHAIRVHGRFAQVRVRSVPRQTPPYRPLAEVVKEQAVFDLKDVDGTLVGYYLPKFSDRINVPGYHLHFLSDDRTSGGHVLALTTGGATAAIDSLDTLRMVLPRNGNFLGADLTGDQTKARNAVERGR